MRPVLRRAGVPLPVPDDADAALAPPWWTWPLLAVVGLGLLGGVYRSHLRRLATQQRPSERNEKTRPARLLTPSPRDEPRLPVAPLPGPSEAPATRPTVLLLAAPSRRCAALQRALRGAYQVDTAASANEALARMREARPDVVVCDHRRPDPGGIAVCEGAAADVALRTIPVFLLVADSGPALLLKALACGAEDVLPVPVDVRELHHRMARSLRTRQYLRDECERVVHVEEAGLDVPDREAALVESVLAAIHDALGDPGLTVDRLADAVALSRRQLTRRLRTATGETPAALIRRLRLERAATLLSDNDDVLVSDVARTVGFRSASHFSTAFKQHFDCTPSAYRA